MAYIHHSYTESSGSSSSAHPLPLSGSSSTTRHRTGSIPISTVHTDQARAVISDKGPTSHSSSRGEALSGAQHSGQPSYHYPTQEERARMMDRAAALRRQDSDPRDRLSSSYPRSDDTFHTENQESRYAGSESHLWNNEGSQRYGHGHGHAGTAGRTDSPPGMYLASSNTHQQQEYPTQEYYSNTSMHGQARRADSDEFRKYSDSRTDEPDHSSAYPSGAAPHASYSPNLTAPSEDHHSHSPLASPGNPDSSWRGMSSTSKDYPSAPNGSSSGGKTGLGSIMKGYATRNQLLYITTVLVQVAVSVTLILFIWIRIRSQTPQAIKDLSTSDQDYLRWNSITVYLAIFLLGAVFEILITLDALRLNNTIQLIGTSLFCVAMMIYAALLDGQIQNAVSNDTAGREHTGPEFLFPDDLYSSVRPFIFAMPIIQGVAALVLAWLTWLLFQDFGWEVLHLIGADRKLKKMYTRYQIFVCLLKFDFFFFVGFSLQYIILVLQITEPEFIITLVAFPITILFLFLAAVACRREIRSLVYVIFFVEICGLAYFVFKLFRLFQPSQLFRYETSRKTLAVFSSLAIAMLLLTFWTTVICYSNFGEGLKEIIPSYWQEHKTGRRTQQNIRNQQRKNSLGAKNALQMQQRQNQNDYGAPMPQSGGRAGIIDSDRMSID